MNKTAIIIGSVALLGVGAFFYFKTKSKGETSSIEAEEGASTPAVDKETKALKDIATKITESETKPKDKSVDVVPAVTYENIEKALVSLGIDQTRTAQELASSNYKEARKLAENMKQINSMKGAINMGGGSGGTWKYPESVLEQYSTLSGQKVTSRTQTGGAPPLSPSKAELLSNMTKKINALGYKVLHDYDIEKI